MNINIDRKHSTAPLTGERIVITLSNGDEFTITEEFGKLRVLGHGREILIKPGSANVIGISLTPDE